MWLPMLLLTFCAPAGQQIASSMLLLTFCGRRVSSWRFLARLLTLLQYISECVCDVRYCGIYLRYRICIVSEFEKYIVIAQIAIEFIRFFYDSRAESGIEFV